MGGMDKSLKGKGREESREFLPPSAIGRDITVKSFTQLAIAPTRQPQLLGSSLVSSLRLTSLGVAMVSLVNL